MVQAFVLTSPTYLYLPPIFKCGIDVYIILKGL